MAKKASYPALRVSFGKTAFRARVADGAAAEAQIEVRELARRARQQGICVADFEAGFWELAARHGPALHTTAAKVQIWVNLACGSFPAPRVLPSCEHRARRVLRQLAEKPSSRTWSIEEAKREVASVIADFRAQPVHDPEEKLQLRFCYTEGTFLCPRVGSFV